MERTTVYGGCHKTGEEAMAALSLLFDGNL